MRRFRTLLALALLALLAVPSRGEEDALGTRTWTRVRKLLPIRLWQTDTRARRRAKVDRTWRDLDLDRAILTKKQFAQLGAILRAGSPFTTEKRRRLDLSIATGKAGGKEVMPVLVEVTSKYKPGCGRSFPLVVTTHGGPMNDLPSAVTASRTQFRVWKAYTSTAECIVAAPALTGQGFGAREWTFLENLVRKIDEIYNVDHDRILLTGHSWGGILTWHLGPPHADRFCLLAPFVCAINPGRAHLENLRALPVYHVQGRKDIAWILRTGRERKKVLDDLGYEHEYRELPGGHIVFSGEVPKIAKRLANLPRRMYAREIVRRRTTAGHNTSDHWYWIRTADRDFRASIDPKTRTIDADIDGDFEVFLHDAMLDLDEPVTIRRDGETVFAGRVKRSLRFALAHVKETGDRGRVFAASVKID